MTRPDIKLVPSPEETPAEAARRLHAESSQKAEQAFQALLASLSGVEADLLEMAGYPATPPRVRQSCDALASAIQSGSSNIMAVMGRGR